jgi:hypothetical protein
MLFRLLAFVMLHLLLIGGVIGIATVNSDAERIVAEAAAVLARQ